MADHVQASDEAQPPIDRQPPTGKEQKLPKKPHAELTLQANSAKHPVPDPDPPKPPPETPQPSPTPPPVPPDAPNGQLNQETKKVKKHYHCLICDTTFETDDIKNPGTNHPHYNHPVAYLDIHHEDPNTLKEVVDFVRKDMDNAFKNAIMVDRVNAVFDFLDMMKTLMNNPDTKTDPDEEKSHHPPATDNIQDKPIQ